VFVVVSRQVLIDSSFASVICAPIYSAYHGLSTQVPIGAEAGLKHLSSVNADELVSLPKVLLTDYLGTLPTEVMTRLERAMSIALGIAQDH
jgi:mRNA interferase MazF